jgi:hypothetical protein
VFFVRQIELPDLHFKRVVEICGRPVRACKMLRVLMERMGE